MKYVLIIALLCASFVSFSQTPLDTRKAPKKCGYSSEASAGSASEGASLANMFDNPEETISDVKITQEGNSWCYQNTYTCHNTLNKEQKQSKSIAMGNGCKTDSPPIVSK